MDTRDAKLDYYMWKMQTARLLEPVASYNLTTVEAGVVADLIHAKIGRFIRPNKAKFVRGEISVLATLAVNIDTDMQRSLHKIWFDWEPRGSAPSPTFHAKVDMELLGCHTGTYSYSPKKEVRDTWHEKYDGGQVKMIVAPAMCYVADPAGLLPFVPSKGRRVLHSAIFLPSLELIDSFRPMPGVSRKAEEAVSAAENTAEEVGDEPEAEMDKGKGRGRGKAN